MKRKIIIVSILAVLMLITISYATAVNTIDADKKESPLYTIRTRQAITERISSFIDNIKTRFLGERIFFIPFASLINDNTGYSRLIFFTKNTECSWRLITCDYTCGFHGETMCFYCTLINPPQVCGID